MRDAFSAYRGMNRRQLRGLWSNAIFSFDTSTLLNLYKSEPETNEQFFSILEGLGSRIWLAYQAGQEFYDNRGALIARGRKELERLEEISKVSPNYLRPSATEKIVKILKEEAEHFQEFLDADEIESRLNRLFKGKVGKPYPNLHEKYVEAELRFKLKIPPGFRDESNKDDYRKYGDVIVWFQLMDYAEKTKTSVIFVTAEAKPDWWLTGEHKKRLGPRPELAQEMRARAGVGFHMYSTTEFVKHASDYLGVKSKPARVRQAVEDLQRIEKEAVMIPTNWISSRGGYGGDGRIVSYGGPAPNLLPNQLYRPFPDSGAGYNTYGYGVGSPGSLYDMQGNPLYPNALAPVFLTASGAQPPATSPIEEPKGDKAEHSDKEKGSKPRE